MNKEPSVLTRMRLSCCWGDNLNEKELNEVVDYINHLQQENQQLKEQLHKASLDMQELTERDILCPTTCDKLQRYESILDEIRKVIESYNLGKYDYSIPQIGIIELFEILDKAKESE